jgi:hypothetical protein
MGGNAAADNETGRVEGGPCMRELEFNQCGVLLTHHSLFAWRLL